ncbi:thioredoxin-1 [Artemisia annua]|uniref:Thioredoxin-1 n=1 Tax=Artemisia annua TaxID=35608 RepID=A0A2U1NIW8_ARTAN|nr:thioredoxin-1 [Artemisia annua]
MASVISSSSTSSSTIQFSHRRSTSPPSLSSPTFLRRRLFSFHQFSGLKIQQKQSVSLSSQRVSKRVAGSSIVCEASSDTALDVPSVTNETWESLVLKADGPVMVEFWAPWCGPCRMLLPVIGELAKEYTGRLKCYKLNTDDSPSIATQYGIRSIPTIMIFLNGEKKDAIIGAVPKTTLTASIEKFL